MAGLGNAILAVPMVRQLKRFRPNAHVTVVARTSSAAEVYLRLREVNELHVMSTPRQVLAALQRLRRRRADICLIPFPSNRWQYILLAVATGARRRVLHGYPSGGVRALSFVPAERVDAVAGMHDVVQNLRLLGRLDIEPDQFEAPQFFLNRNDRLRAQDLLKAEGLSERNRIIAIHPGSAKTVIGEAKRWPSACYGRLIRDIGREWDMSAVILEGPDERGIGKEILDYALPAAAPVVRVSRVGDAAGILERAALFVGSDSGLAHLSAAVGTRAVTIFGPADPERACPFGCRDLVVQPRGMPCVPCSPYPMKSTRPRTACKKADCLAAVDVEAVLAKIRYAFSLGTTGSHSEASQGDWQPKELLS
ncbi:MAG: glycosyltransferase family 9 protein [Planctomycetota bacterium]|jgi:ADP-heptose:LPS heptosyltransferase